MPINDVRCILQLIFRKIYKDREISDQQLADLE